MPQVLGISDSKETVFLLHLFLNEKRLFTYLKGAFELAAGQGSDNLLLLML